MAISLRCNYLYIIHLWMDVVDPNNKHRNMGYNFLCFWSFWQPVEATIMAYWPVGCPLYLPVCVEANQPIGFSLLSSCCHCSCHQLNPLKVIIISPCLQRYVIHLEPSHVHQLIHNMISNMNFVTPVT